MKKNLYVLLILLSTQVGFSQGTPPCTYSGPSLLINEIAQKPGNSSSDPLYQTLKDCSDPTDGYEYIELYNPNPCEALDISCYILSSSSYSNSTSGAFRFPSGTSIPAMGFISIGGPNSGATFDMSTYCGDNHLVTGSDRWYLYGGDAYVSLYDDGGNLLNAVYWTTDGDASKWGVDSDLDQDNQYIPNPATCSIVATLPGAASVPINDPRVEHAGQSAALGNSLSRTTDGGNVWDDITPTINTCNGACCTANISFTTTSATVSAEDSTSCTYSGPSIVINEIAQKPGTHGSDALYQSLKDCDCSGEGYEYIELYNPNPCEALDISYYIVSSSSYSNSTSGAFRFPAGTTIPPLGFVSIGGPNAQVTFNMYDYCGTPNLVTGNDRWYLENGDAYVSLYDETGDLLNAVYWTSNGDASKWGTDSDLDQDNPFIPNPPGAPVVTNLPGAASVPINDPRVEHAGESATLGNSLARITDGGSVWGDIAPTTSSCNGDCAPPVDNNENCDGTASVTPAGGVGPYVYLWDEAAGEQTTSTATDLCVGCYDVTVVDQGTGCSYVVNVCVDNTFKVDYNVTQETPNDLGSIQLMPSGGTPPYYYFWDDGNQSQNRYGLESGIYTVTIIDTLLDSLELLIPVGSELEFESMDSQVSFIEGNKLVKTGVDGWGNGRATLLNKPEGDGEVRVEILEDDNEFVFGYRKSSEQQVSTYQDLSYGLYVESNNLYAYDLSGLQTIGTVEKGDVIAIEQKGTVLFYKKNEEILHETPLESDSYEIDASLRKARVIRIKPIRFRFWPLIVANIKHNKCYMPDNGEIDLTFSGGILPYTYSWNTGSTSNHITGLSSGKYTLTLEMNFLGRIISMEREYEVGYHVNWTNEQGVENIVSDRLINNTNSNGYGGSGASSNNVMSTSENQWIKFKLENNLNGNNQLAIGITANDLSYNKEDIEYGLVFNYLPININFLNLSFTIRYIRFIDQGAEVGSNSFNEGDVFIIRYNKNTGQITYEKEAEGVLFSSSIIPKDYIVDVALAENTAGLEWVFTSFGCAPFSSYSPQVVLKKKLDGGYYIPQDNSINFKFTEEYNPLSISLTYNVYNEASPSSSVNLVDPNIKYGDNRYSLDVSSLAPGFYILEVVNDKNEKWYLRFKKQ